MKHSIKPTLTLLAALLLRPLDAASSDGYLDAGVGSVDITPTEPVVLAGSPTPLKSIVGKHSPVCEGAGSCRHGRQKVAIVTLDTLKYPVEHVVRARQQIETDHRHPGQQRHHLRLPHAPRPAVELLQGPAGNTHRRGGGAGRARSHAMQARNREGQGRGRERVPQGDQRRPRVEPMAVDSGGSGQISGGRPG